MQPNAFGGGGVQIAELLPKIVSERGEPIVGVIDRLTADFALVPLPGGRPAVMALLLVAGSWMSAKPCGFCQSTCMMRKVHSDMIVHSEGDRVRIERIDLKVW